MAQSLKAKQLVIERQIGSIAAQIRGLERKISQLKERRETLLVANSPIKAGNLIEWCQGQRGRRYGRVHSVKLRWNRTYEYRTVVLRVSTGTAIGMANVTEENQPQKTDRESFLATVAAATAAAQRTADLAEKVATAKAKRKAKRK